MRGRYRSIFFAKDYAKCVTAKGKCQLDAPPHEYEPLFNCINFPSRGFRTMFGSWIVNRTMHPVSMPEYETIAMYHEPGLGVVNLAEQYALDPAITREIAFEMRIDHPAIREIAIIMSTDLVVTFRRPGGVLERHAIAVKQAKDLSRRVLEKLAIEQEYWRRRNTPWRLLLDTRLPRQLIQNMELLIEYVDPERVPCDAFTIERVATCLMAQIGSAAPLRTLCKDCDASFELSPGTALAAAYHLTIQGRLPLDLRGAYLPKSPLSKTVLAA